MKKIVLCMAVIAMGGMTMTSCQKEESVKMSQLTFHATAETDNNKTSLSGNNLSWTGDETIMVSNGTSNGEYTVINNTATIAEFACVEGADIVGETYYVTYPASIFESANTVNLPAVQQYDAENGIDGFPMYAVSTDRTLQFKNLCGIMRLEFKGEANVASISITTDKGVNGSFEISDNQVAAYATSDNGKKTVTLNCGNGVIINENEATTFNIYMPTGEYSTFDITITTTDGRQVVKSLNGATFTIERNRAYTLTRTLEFPAPEDAINGLFTVGMDANGSPIKVYFSKGNLFYDGTQFAFENEQYDYRTYSGLAANISGAATTTPADHWGLFSWSTNGTYGRYTNTDPYTHTGSFEDWTGAFGDASPWRTLSKDEWAYLQTGRPNADSKRAQATVNGTQGLIFLPDNFTLPADITFQSGGTSFIRNVYTSTQWEQMEEAGAVFFPAAGIRTPSGELNSGVYYWSSTKNPTTNNMNAYAMSGTTSTGQYARNNGLSVRLVQNNIK